MAKSKSRRLTVPSLPFSVADARMVSTAVAESIIGEVGLELPSVEILVDISGAGANQDDVADPVETVLISRTRYLAFAINMSLHHYSVALHERVKPTSDEVGKRLNEILVLLDRLVEKCGVSDSGRSAFGAVFKTANLESNLREKTRYGPQLSRLDRTLTEFYHNRIVDYREAIRLSIVHLEDRAADQAKPVPNPTDVLVRELAIVFADTFGRRPGLSVSNGTYPNRDKAGPFLRFLSAVFGHAFGDQTEWPSKSVEHAARTASVGEIENPLRPHFHGQLADSFEASSPTM